MKVFLIVLNWNNIDDTKNTIYSLLKQDYFDYKILLVDNNSEDSCKKVLLEEFPFIEHLLLDQNYGYTGGNNKGIEFAIKNGADLIVFANNDIEVEDSTLISKAVEIFRKDQKTGILGPFVMDFKNRNVIQESGSYFFTSEKSSPVFNKFRNENLTNENLNFVDGVSGAFLFVRSSVIQIIGVFDDKLFMYGDETDFCLRCWMSGFYCAVSKDLVIYHKGSESNGINYLTQYYKVRNSLYLLIKYNRNISKYFIIRFFIDYFKLFFIRFKDIGFSVAFNTIIIPIIHACIGRMGKKRNRK